MASVLYEVPVKEEKIEVYYLGRAAQHKEWLSQEKDFFSAERFSRPAARSKLPDMSVWQDEERVARRGNSFSHRMRHGAGRIGALADCKSTAVPLLRAYAMKNRQKAPSDSSAYLRTMRGRKAGGHHIG